ncbi:haloacid dehalogenase-like hydrolase [Microvirga terrestris]|uniref:haloacid dehalogenase-like hydrolase n=1 Tax=Microvirga terrestris TaxID=2791024 RepID=UPI0031BA672D
MQSELKTQTLPHRARSPHPHERSERRHERDETHWTTHEIETPGQEGARPLVVDLDGTLIASDLLIETAFSELGRRPQSMVDMLMALSRGKAVLKHRLSKPADFDPGTLPYDPEVLSLIRQARAAGRRVYLASASHQRLVESIADYLVLFTGWFASNETTNLAGHRKAQQLVEAFGERGFDYVGNDAADLPVWEKAAKSIAIRAPAGCVDGLPANVPMQST